MFGNTIFNHCGVCMKSRLQIALRFFFFSITLSVMGGCKPDKLTIEIYSSDVEIAALGQEVIDVPIKVEFSLLGDDEEGLLDRVITTSKEYLSPDSTYTKSKAMFGEQLVIQTKIPMGTSSALSRSESRLANLVVGPGISQRFRIDFYKTKALDDLARELGNINLMIGLELPADESVFRVISDSRVPVTVSGIAVFVSKKPHLVLQHQLDRRESIELVYKGGEASIYSEVPPLFEINM